MLYLIPFLHQTTTIGKTYRHRTRCILFHFYIKPQLLVVSFCSSPSCILLHFYIKPQPCNFARLKHRVVSYYISTSNHNSVDLVRGEFLVVSYYISTSNHNLTTMVKPLLQLYLITFLHQTTTKMKPSTLHQ